MGILEGLGELGLPDEFSASSLEELQELELPIPQQSGARALTLFVLLSILFILYYLVCVVNRPQVVGSGGSLQHHLLSHCPSLRQCYWPTPWAFNCHLNTIIRSLLQRSPSVQIHRSIISLPDGGEASLDWMEGCDEQTTSIPPNAPILLVMTGLTGCSGCTYVQHICVDGLATGYRPVVFNQRGTGGLLLKTPRAYCSTKIDDLQLVLDMLRLHFPSSPIVGVGISLGGMILTQYLHQVGSQGDLSAVLVVSCPWDVFKSRSSLEENYLNKKLYSQYLCNNMKELVTRNIAVLGDLPFDISPVFKSKTLSQVDEHLTCPQFGYGCLDDYYKAATNRDKVHKVETPLFCVTAADDPFVPKSSIPYEEFSSNPHTVLAVTSHGGHFGYLQGILPTSSTWMNTLCREFLTAINKYQQ